MSKVNGSKLDVNVEVFIIKEGEVFVSYCPALDLASQGDSFDEAVQAFDEALDIFFEEITEMGTLDDVLKDCGWKKVQKHWEPPLVVGQTQRTFHIPA